MPEFFPPRDFLEFYSRSPKFCLQMAMQFLRRRYPDPDTEDLCNDLLAHLASPCRDGQDRISKFDATQYCDMGAGTFYAWVKTLCLHWYLNEKVKQDHRPLCQRDNLSLVNKDSEDFDPGEASPEYLHRTGTYFSGDDPMRRILMAEFRAFVAARNPKLLGAIEKIAAGESLGRSYEIRQLRRLATTFTRRRRV